MRTAPVQVSSVKRSPLSGSIEIVVGQVNPAEIVLVTVPLEGSSCITAPVVTLPEVTSRLANKLPLESKARPASVTPSEVLLSCVAGSRRATAGRELVDVPGGELVDVQIPRTVERDTGRSLAAEIDAAVPPDVMLGRETGGVRRDDKAGRGGRKTAAAGVARTAGEVDVTLPGTARLPSVTSTAV